MLCKSIRAAQMLGLRRIIPGLKPQEENMAKKEEAKEVKEHKKEAPKKEDPKQEAVQEAKKEKKQDKRHEGKDEKKDSKGAPKEGKKETPKARETGPEIKHFVRIANTDLDGKKSVQYGLIGIKGIGRRAAKILTVNSAVDPKATLGY